MFLMTALVSSNLGPYCHRQCWLAYLVVNGINFKVFFDLPLQQSNCNLQLQIFEAAGPANSNCNLTARDFLDCRPIKNLRRPQ